MTTGRINQVTVLSELARWCQGELTTPCTPSSLDTTDVASMLHAHWRPTTRQDKIHRLQNIRWELLPKSIPCATSFTLLAPIDNWPYQHNVSGALYWTCSTSHHSLCGLLLSNWARTGGLPWRMQYISINFLRSPPPIIALETCCPIFSKTLTSITV